jgi:hypothetical protein
MPESKWYYQSLVSTHSNILQVQVETGSVSIAKVGLAVVIVFSGLVVLLVHDLPEFSNASNICALCSRWRVRRVHVLNTELETMEVSNC